MSETVTGQLVHAYDPQRAENQAKELYENFLEFAEQEQGRPFAAEFPMLGGEPEVDHHAHCYIRVLDLIGATYDYEQEWFTTPYPNVYIREHSYTDSSGSEIHISWQGLKWAIEDSRPSDQA